MVENGTKIFEDAPEITTLLYEYLFDLDIEGTYPNEEAAFNISKETTRFEFSKIEGMSEEQKRQFSLLLTGGKSNALEIANRYMNFPSPVEFRDAYRKYKGLPAIEDHTKIQPLYKSLDKAA